MINTNELDQLIKKVANDLQHKLKDGIDIESGIVSDIPAAPADIKAADLAGLIDHTLLKPEAVAEQVEKLCQEAKQYHFASVCVNPAYVALSAAALKGAPEKVCTVIGFPLGANIPAVKAYEAQAAIDQGAQELDMVVNIGALKGGDFQLVYDDIKGVVDAAKGTDALVKVIMENVLLSDEEKVAACLIAKAAGVDFVKTSTGFAGGGATVEDVALMRRVVGAEIGVKAAGGIRSYADAKAMVQAGANRIGASAGVKIVQGEQGGEGY